MGHSTHRGGFLKPRGCSLEDSGVLGRKGCTAITCVVGAEGTVDADWVFRYGMGVTQVKGGQRGGGESYSRTVYDKLRVRGSLGCIA